MIDPLQRNVYLYGYEVLISELIHNTILAIIAIYTHHITETICFVTSFTFLREAAGGYHARTHRNCILIFSGVYLIFLYLLEQIPIHLYREIAVGILIVHFILIALFAPVDDENKPFNEKKKKLYRKKSLKRTAILILLSLACMLGPMPLMKWGFCISLSCIAVSISVGIAYFKTKSKR